MTKKKILVVEDETLVAMDIKNSLKLLGYMVPAVAVSGEEAVIKAQEIQPDLILMDIRLKGEIDGVTAARLIRTKWNIPVVYLTAYSDELTLERAKITQPFGYLLKPFEEEELRVTIEIALSRFQAEAKIRQALVREQELREQKSSFVSIVSHECRTPLSKVLLATELLERYSKHLVKDKHRKYFEQIKGSIQDMRQLLDEVLFIEKAEGNKLNFKPTPINLVEFCSDLVEQMQLATEGSHRIIFTPQCNIPDAYMDTQLLRYIFNNLLSNGIKYSPLGGTVEFQLTVEGNWAIFKIIDSGIGIPKQEFSQLFEPFQRASNVGDIPGTGLGLSIVNKSVEQHRGQILVDSQVGVGTVFTVRLPLSTHDWQ